MPESPPKKLGETQIDRIEIWFNDDIGTRSRVTVSALELSRWTVGGASFANRPLDELLQRVAAQHVLGGASS